MKTVEAMVIGCTVVLGYGCSRMDAWEVEVRNVSWGELTVSTRETHGAKSVDKFYSLGWIPGNNSPSLQVRMPNSAFVRADQVRKVLFAVLLHDGTAQQTCTAEECIINVQYGRGQLCAYFDNSGKVTLIQIFALRGRDRARCDAPAVKLPGGDGVMTFPLRESELRARMGIPTEDIVITGGT